MSYKQLFKYMPEDNFIEKYISDNFIVDEKKNKEAFDNSNNKYVTSHFIFNKVVYKKLKFHDRVKDLVEYLRTKYFLSKQEKYLNVSMTYKRFITILRQVCKVLRIDITSKIVYSNSTYEMTYFISF